MSFSVIVPTTRPDLLPRALRSIADQRVPPGEVLVLHDGGPPLDLGAWPFPLRSYGIMPRLGPALARNVLAATAREDRLAFLDDDDVWLPDHLARLGGADAAGLAFTDAWLHHDVEGWTRLFAFSFTPELLRRTNPIILSTVGLGRAAFWQVGGFDASLARYEAWDLFLRLQAAGTRLQRIAGPDVHYHYSRRSLTADDAAMAQAFSAFCQRHGLLLGRKSFASMLDDPELQTVRLEDAGGAATETE